MRRGVLATGGDRVSDLHDDVNVGYGSEQNGYYHHGDDDRHEYVPKCFVLVYRFAEAVRCSLVYEECWDGENAETRDPQTGNQRDTKRSRELPRREEFYLAESRNGQQSDAENGRSLERLWDLHDVGAREMCVLERSDHLLVDFNWYRHCTHSQVGKRQTQYEMEAVMSYCVSTSNAVDDYDGIAQKADDHYDAVRDQLCLFKMFLVVIDAIAVVRVSFVLHPNTKRKE